MNTITRPTRTVAPALVGLLLLGAAACGGTASSADRPDTTEPPPSEVGDGGGAAMCAPGVTDCVDAVLDPAAGGSDPVWDDFPSEAASEDAKGLLGLNEADVPVDVRIGRRGGEHMALTEDYVLGRLTVGLDDDGSGFRVTDVTIELPDGPATFELQPG